MVAKAHTFTLEGPNARHVVVELDVRSGLPAFTIVGLADAAVREARERIQTAVRNSGFEWPRRRITANLAPGDLRKAGPGLDLALACAILAATGQVPAERLGRIGMFGELGLDGSVRPAHGTLAVADEARRRGLGALALAAPACHVAALVEGLEIAPLRTLQSAARLLRGGPADPLPERFEDGRAGAVDAREPELAEVRGAAKAVRALLVAAAGGHSLLLSGPPGVGNTMLARRLPGILPPLDGA
jgi:magnesium chelatase family protein